MSKLTKVLVTILIVLILVLMGLGAFWFFKNNVIVDKMIYPKNSEFLNLSGKEITVEQYEKIQEKLPNCQIYWNVPVDGNRYGLDTHEVTVKNLTEADVKALSYLNRLKTVHAVGCTDYELLRQVAQQHPNCLVEYAVTIDGTSYMQDASALQLKKLTEEDMALVKYLPDLLKIDAEGCTDYVLLAELAAELPQVQVEYSIDVAGKKVEVNTEELTIQDAVPADVGQVLPHLRSLKTLMLINPKGEMKDIQSLQTAFPNVVIDWQLERNGLILSKEAEDLDLSGVTLNSIQEIEDILAFCPNVKQVYLGIPNIDNE